MSFNKETFSNASSRMEETITIPDGKISVIIGKGGVNIKRIKNESGAKVAIDTSRPTHTVKLTGTVAQRSHAKKIIGELINRTKIIPTIGFTLLGSDDTFNLKEAKFRFVKFIGNDSNSHSQEMDKYYIERVPDDPNDKRGDDAIDDLANQLRNGLTLPSPTGGFVTWDKFDECLEAIFGQLSKADPTNSEGKEIRLNIFFGRQLFSKISNEIFDAHDWCAFKREVGTVTSFQHNSPRIVDNMSSIQEKFGLKLQKETLAGDRGSISVYHVRKGKRMKLKLHWFKEEGWKITRAARDIQREGIVDLVSGTSMPDMRFLLKSQRDIRIDDKDKAILVSVQSRPLIEREGLWFRISDFDGKLECNSIRQTIRKKVYSNEKFQVTLQSVLQEFKLRDGDGKQVSTEETISVKNRSWRAVENIDKLTTLHFDEEELSISIRDTIEFAREIAKIIK